ncbi:MAG: hypothetical protein QOF96_1550, partial [Actinomycetota bacterium]|nr:hypothetical protein [Actinomycetota bacterium]
MKKVESATEVGEDEAPPPRRRPGR